MTSSTTRHSIVADECGRVGVWTRTANRFGWASLLGAEPGAPDVSPYAAAAPAPDLAGLPPTSGRVVKR